MQLVSQRRGYTLIEVLIAAAIIAVLTAIGIVSYSSINRRSRDVKRQGDLEQMRSALEMYRADIGFYPPINTSGFDTVENLQTDLITTGAYIPALPADPQPDSHLYYYLGTNRDALNGNYYGYCLCGYMETLTAENSSCLDTLPAACNYGIKNP